jgi:hypothetical protein
MDFKVYVVATELRRKILPTVAPYFSGFFLDCRAQKDSDETATKGDLTR